jgi:hypothetical protein
MTQPDLVKIDEKGTSTLHDTRFDPTWGDVEAVEDRRDPTGKLLTRVNHRDYDKAVEAFLADLPE